MRAPILAAFALLAASASAPLAMAPLAAADSIKDGQISVTPGMWNWKQTTSVIGVPIEEENLECLIPEEATISLSKLAYDLDEGCTVDNVLPAAAGYSFQLICKGDIPGKADATLTHSDRSMAIRAKGSARVMGIPAGFSMKADATYVGECSAEDAAKQKQKWLDEQAARP